MTPPRRLDRVDERTVDALADVLVDCVAGGASVGFLAPLTRGRAAAFWRRVGDDVAAGRRLLLVSDDDEGVVGTVHLNLDLPENQPHRADVTKMLVHRRARRRGVGAALLRAIEAEARDAGRTVLMLDTVTGGEADRLYRSLGWHAVGDVADFALFPDGSPCSTTFFRRSLHGPADRPGTGAPGTA